MIHQRNPLRRGAFAFSTLLVLLPCGCGAGGGGGGNDNGTGRVPPSTIRSGMGWRTVTSFPEEPDPSGGYYPYDFQPVGATYIGTTPGTLHAELKARSNGPSPYSGGVLTWISFDAAHDDHPLDHKNTYMDPQQGYGQAMVRDLADSQYVWHLAFSLSRVTYSPETDSWNNEVVFPGTGVAAGPADERSLVVTSKLDIAILGTHPDGAGGVGCPPTLYVRPHGGTGQNYAADRSELYLPDDQYLDSIPYNCDLLNGMTQANALFYPEGGVPYVFQLARSSGQRRHLDVFAPVDEASKINGFKRLRRVGLQMVAAGTTELHLVATPNRAWVLLVDGKRAWSVYRFDRSTGALTLEYTLPAPGDLRQDDDLAVTDDGTLYVRFLTPPGTAEEPRVVRIVGGQVTELWNAGIAASPDHIVWGLYSTGARLYTIVSQSYPVTFLPGGPMTFYRPRWSFITPDIDDVSTPALSDVVPPAPATCNPLSASPCPAGQTCAVGAGPTGFVCRPDRPTAALCAACKLDGTPSCASGYWCRLDDTQDINSGRCVRLCCEQADCGPAVCVKPSPQTPVGYCARGNDYAPACAGMPAVPPSGGSCLM